MNQRSFIIFCLAFLSASFGVATIAPQVPSIAREFGVSTMKASHISWFYMLPYGFFALVWAPLTRVMTVKKILVFTSLGFAVSTFWFSMARTLNEACVAEFFVGCFACSFMPLTLITIGKTVPPAEKGKYIGTLFGLAYISTFIGVMLTGILFWRVVYWVPAVASLVTCVLALIVCEPLDFRQGAFKISYGESLRDKKAVSLLGLIFCASFLYHSLQQLLGVYLNGAYGLGQGVLSSIFVMGTMCAIIFQFSGGMLTKRVPAAVLVRTGFFLMAGFATCLVFNQYWPFMYLLMLLWGSGWALNHVGLSTNLAHLPEKVLRDASGLNSAIRFSSGGLGVMSANALITAVGFKAHFAVVALGMIMLSIFTKRALSE